MIEVIGVRFKDTGKVYYFDPDNYKIDQGTMVVVETSRGIEMGEAVTEIKMVEDKEIVKPLKKVIRIANNNDHKQYEENRQSEKEAFTICEEKIAKHNLEMNLVDVEYTFDKNKVIFYFTADGRVDFRELVKDLAGVFRTRIELRQIGVRDEAKMLGGIGICGREFCCSTFLADFNPVSIKMAKEQNLSLNPTKISGCCGRLMCCLKYEQDTYVEINKITPDVGSVVRTKDGVGQVRFVSPLRGILSVHLDDEKESKIEKYKVSDVTIVKKKRFKSDEKVDFNELKKLED